MSMLSVIKAKLGQAANTAHNFLFDASAADGTMKLARENGQQVMTVDANGKVAFPQGTAGGQLTVATAQNSTGGTSIDFTGIPSWVKRITVMFNGVSTNGTSVVRVQLGATTIQTTGYVGTATNMTGGVATGALSGGFDWSSSTAADTRSGAMTFTNMVGNTWTCVGVGGLGNVAQTLVTGGLVTLSGTLDRIRVTTANGTDTFDAGAINIMYEG